MKFHELLTLDDNETLDLGRLLWALGVVAFITLSTYTTVRQDKPFDAQAFGVGFAAVLAAGGGMVQWMRDKASG